MNHPGLEFYERYGAQWTSPDRREVERQTAAYKVSNLCSLMEGIRPERILDFGCGLGDALDLLSSRLRPQVSIGMDISSTMLEHARRTHPQYDFVLGGIERLRDHSVDLITFFDVLEHLEDIPATLEAARASARYIGIKIPLERTWFISVLNALRLKENRSRLYETEGHLYEFNKAEVEGIVRRSGLEIIGAKVDFVPKHILFSGYLKDRMKARRGAVGRAKYLAYSGFSRLPYPLTRPVFETVNGTDLFLLCRSPRS